MPRALSREEIEEFRRQLCAVAARLFAERGFAGVTLRAIAGELGCSAMTPYRYFADKQEIFDAVRAEAFARLGKHIESHGGDDPDPVSRFRKMGHAYVGFGVKEPEAYRIMFQLDQSAPEQSQAQLEDQAFRCGWDLLGDTIAALIEQGTVDGDPETLTHLVWSSLHGLVTLHLAGKFRLGRSLDELLEPAIDFFLCGAAPGPQARR